MSDVRYTHPLCDAFIEAAVQLGYPRNNDFNGKVQEGVGYQQTATCAASSRSEYLPGPDVQSDADLLDYARRTGGTTFHQTSTCRMGPDPMAVVDAELRVHGIGGLRVVDASIMPTVASGNTNAPTILIAEKASDMIRGRAPLAAAA